jgi:hypothetical protein
MTLDFLWNETEPPRHELVPGCRGFDCFSLAVAGETDLRRACFVDLSASETCRL